MCTYICMQIHSSIYIDHQYIEDKRKIERETEDRESAWVNEGCRDRSLACEKGMRKRERKRTGEGANEREQMRGSEWEGANERKREKTCTWERGGSDNEKERDLVVHSRGRSQSEYRIYRAFLRKHKVPFSICRALFRLNRVFFETFGSLSRIWTALFNTYRAILRIQRSFHTCVRITLPDATYPWKKTSVHSMYMCMYVCMMRVCVCAYIYSKV